MRYVCKVFAEGTLYAYETTNDGFTTLKEFVDKKPKKVKRIITYAEIIPDNNKDRINGFKRAIQTLNKIVFNQKIK